MVARHHAPRPPADIRAVAGAEAETKELRVRIDAAYVARLHAYRLLRHKKVADAVEEALDLFFERERFQPPKRP